MLSSAFFKKKGGAEAQYMTGAAAIVSNAQAACRHTPVGICSVGGSRELHRLPGGRAITSGCRKYDDET